MDSADDDARGPKRRRLEYDRQEQTSSYSSIIDANDIPLNLLGDYNGFSTVDEESKEELWTSLSNWPNNDVDGGEIPDVLGDDDLWECCYGMVR
jgi:hypothetical protein